MLVNIFNKAVPPISRWLARTFFNETRGRSLTKKTEDEWGINRIKFHAALLGGALIATVIILFLLDIQLFFKTVFHTTSMVPDYILIGFLIYVILTIIRSIKSHVDTVNSMPHQ